MRTPAGVAAHGIHIAAKQARVSASLEHKSSSEAVSGTRSSGGSWPTDVPSTGLRFTPAEDGGVQQALLDMPLPCKSSHGLPFLLPQSVGVFLHIKPPPYGPLDHFLLEVPLNGYDEFRYAVASSKELFGALRTQMDELCTSSKLSPGWEITDCASDLMFQIDRHMRGLCSEDRNPGHRQRRFAGLGGNCGIPAVLRFAWLRSESSPFDNTISSAQSALALLSGRVKNLTADVRPAVSSDLNERYRQKHSEMTASIFLGRPFSPAAQILFAHDVICEWQPRPKCISLSAFHQKYERRRRRLFDWINDDDADLDLIFMHVSDSLLKQAQSKAEALLDIAKVNALLAHRPNVRVRTIEASLPCLREQCEANFEYQRRVSQDISKSLVGTHAANSRFRAIKFERNEENLNETCGWMKLRRELTPDSFWLEDWYDRLIQTSSSHAISLFYNNTIPGYQ